ncbi:acyl-CoA dehydrogenase family protein [Amycolatopsis sp. FDAARGOS 1241]|uniref:acyl-CoA dehydrogenase family protein n=1 Tax=Amycolatopsis sp. FDAARGOS 1241 TaxID=2778070 RepID=UPI001EF1A35F|nr:acyl-CoA dehydrogenase family protein [Amycolatopsis sp. FDAARGOS 1241]
MLTEVGRAAAAGPVYAVLALGVLPVEALGTPRQRAAPLPPVVADELLTAAQHEPSAPLTSVPDTAGSAADGVWQLTGMKTGCRTRPKPPGVLTPTALPGGIAVALVDPHADGVELVRKHSFAGAPEYTMRLDRVRITDTDTELLRSRAVTPLPRCTASPSRARSRLAGLLAGALAATSHHVGERTQFGRPLASFQAVAQQIADSYVAARIVYLAATSGRVAAVGRAGRRHGARHRRLLAHRPGAARASDLPPARRPGRRP